MLFHVGYTLVVVAITLVVIARTRSKMRRPRYWAYVAPAFILSAIASGAFGVMLATQVDVAAIESASDLGALYALAANDPTLLALFVAQLVVSFVVGVAMYHWMARRLIDIGASRWWAAAPILASVAALAIYVSPAAGQLVASVVGLVLFVFLIVLGCIPSAEKDEVVEKAVDAF